MKKLLSLFIVLIYIPMIYTPPKNIYEDSDYPPIQIKRETTKDWFVFKQKKRYSHRHYA